MEEQIFNQKDDEEREIEVSSLNKKDAIELINYGFDLQTQREAHAILEVNLEENTQGAQNV